MQTVRGTWKKLATDKKHEVCVYQLQLQELLSIKVAIKAQSTLNTLYEHNFQFS